MKLAAIDIGSNAIRLQITRILPHEDGSISYKGLETIRFPLRLGDDAYRMGVITFRSETKFIQLMMAFRTLLDLYEVDDVYGCATAALRDAKNGERILQRSYDKCGLYLKVITGERESELLELAIQRSIDDKTYIHLDVGGGSTEISFIQNKKGYVRESFKLGSVRNLRKKHDPKEWDRMKEWLLKNRPKEPLTAIGTGGNIKTINRIANAKKLQLLSLTKIEDTIRLINNYSIADRIDILSMREDRADVIPFASEIFLNVMKWSGAKKMMVSDVGLKDGIIDMLYERIK